MKKYPKRRERVEAGKFPSPVPYHPTSSIEDKLTTTTIVKSTKDFHF